MEPEGSLPYSQELSTYTYPEPDQCSPHRTNLSLKYPFLNFFYSDDSYCFRMVQTLIQAGVPKAKVHLIGLSLGGQLAAYVAKAIPGIGRLTGKL
jgi:pimeloyl-ACP methyl ester carboxylesterase